MFEDLQMAEEITDSIYNDRLGPNFFLPANR